MVELPPRYSITIWISARAPRVIRKPLLETQAWRLWIISQKRRERVMHSMDLWASSRLSVSRLLTPKSLEAILATNQKKPLIIIWIRFRRSTIAIWIHISTQAKSTLTRLRMEPYPSSFQLRALSGRSITSWAIISFKVSASAVKPKAKILPPSFHHWLILRGTA